MAKDKVPPFTSIPNIIFDSTTLTGDEKLLYMVLKSHKNKETGICNPSELTLKTDTCMSPYRVKKSKKGLKNKSFISWSYGQHYQCYYQLNLEAETRAEAVEKWKPYKRENNGGILGKHFFDMEDLAGTDSTQLTDSAGRKTGLAGRKTGLAGTDSTQEQEEQYINNKKKKAGGKKPPTKSFNEDSVEFRLAVFLYKILLTDDPSIKKPNLQEWAKPIDLMIRRDKRKPDDIEFIIKWLPGSWWFEKGNIESTEALRKNWGKLSKQSGLSKLIKDREKAKKQEADQKQRDIERAKEEEEYKAYCVKQEQEKKAIADRLDKDTVYCTRCKTIMKKAEVIGKCPKCDNVFGFITHNNKIISVGSQNW